MQLALWCLTICDIGSISALGIALGVVVQSEIGTMVMLQEEVLEEVEGVDPVSKSFPLRRFRGCGGVCCYESALPCFRKRPIVGG